MVIIILTIDHIIGCNFNGLLVWSSRVMTWLCSFLQLYRLLKHISCHWLDFYVLYVSVSDTEKATAYKTLMQGGSTNIWEWTAMDWARIPGSRDLYTTSNKCFWLCHIQQQQADLFSEKSTIHNMGNRTIVCRWVPHTHFFRPYKLYSIPCCFFFTSLACCTPARRGKFN